eukprot:Hpha_TRINITY_DN16384_c3_g3::TRINITY_DN16384_c3_g3_i1::g.62946::m.62946
MGRCCGFGWLVRHEDTRDEARIKTMVFPFAIFVGVFNASVVAHRLLFENQMMTVVGSSIVTFSMLLFMGGAVTNAIPVGSLLDVVLFVCTCGLCVLDLGDATRSSPFRAWALAVLILDSALVFKRYHVPIFIIIPVLM